MFLSAMLPLQVAIFMSIFSYFLPNYSQSAIAQLQELKACDKSNERITWTWHDMKKLFEVLKDLQTSGKKRGQLYLGLCKAVNKIPVPQLL
jgi:hypothetical protein